MIFLKVLWLLLPAGFANMAPIFAARIASRWDTPIDFGHTWKGNGIFGSHKTYRGIVSGMISGAIIFFCQQELYLSFSFIRDLSFFNYHSVSIFFGLWVGLGALGGDLIKSFFKRRLAIAPGQPWIPFDQIDWILGALLSFTVVFRPSFVVMVVSLIIGLTLHFLIKYIGFLWKLSATPL